MRTRRPAAAFLAVSVLVAVVLVTAATLTAVTTAAAAAPRLGTRLGAAAPRLGAAVKPKPTTTTTVAPTTTTVTLPQHGPGGPTNPPPSGSGSGSTTSTTPPAPIIPVAPAVVDSLVRSVQSGLAQLYAINAYDEDKGIVSVYQSNAASADTDAQAAERARAQAQATVSADQAALTESQRVLKALAVALYVRADVGAAATNATASDPDTPNRSVLLALLINHGQDDFEQARRQFANDTAVLKLAQQRAAAAEAEQALAHEALNSGTAQLTTNKLAAAGQKVELTTGTPIPTIMGTPALTAGELAGWYASTGYQANTTVPMATLAGLYLSTGTAAGLRGDIAFAQSIVETGYFSFPSFGQVTGRDNNFAGIGACDSCAHGWTFPNAQTGVAAQVQLLSAYASTKQIPTPLVGRVGVAGCCPTWLSLSGVWATNPNYGYEILSIYQEILSWAIPRRLAAAGL